MTWELQCWRIRYEELKPALLRYFCWLTGNVGDAEDLLHTAFLRLFEANYDPASPYISAALRLTGRREYGRNHRRPRPNKLPSNPEGDGALGPLEPIDPPSAGRALDRRWECERLNEEIPKLPPRHRWAIELDLAGLKDSEIALIMSITVDRVRHLKQEARLKLDHALADVRRGREIGVGKEDYSSESNLALRMELDRRDPLRTRVGDKPRRESKKVNHGPSRWVRLLRALGRGITSGTDRLRSAVSVMGHATDSSAPSSSMESAPVGADGDDELSVRWLESDDVREFRLRIGRMGLYRDGMLRTTTKWSTAAPPHIRETLAILLLRAGKNTWLPSRPFRIGGPSGLVGDKLRVETFIGVPPASDSTGDSVCVEPQRCLSTNTKTRVIPNTKPSVGL